MKKTFSLILLLALCFMTASAAGNTSAQAKKVLDKAAAKVNLKSGATANFSISGGKINQSGTIAIKGNKFNATTGSAIIWFDGKTQWLYTKKNNEVNISSPSAAKQQSMNPYTFLNLYKSGYTMTLENSASGYEVHLVGSGKSISEMYILVDKSYTIKQVKMKQKNQWMTINISNFQQKSLSDAAFQFNAKDYPKAEVIDLR